MATQEVYGVVSAGAASPMLTTGFQLLEALAAEFCPQTASSMAMPWGFHDECRGSFQKRHLIVTCQHALSAGAGLSLESQRPALTGACLIIWYQHWYQTDDDASPS